MNTCLVSARERFQAKQILCSSRQWLSSGAGLRTILAACIVALFLTQSHVLGQNLGSTPQFNQAVQGQQGNPGRRIVPQHDELDRQRHRAGRGGWRRAHGDC